MILVFFMLVLVLAIPPLRAILLWAIGISAQIFIIIIFWQAVFAIAGV